MYRRGGKLLYRYISSRLVFAMDTEGRLTLNSANTVIPEIPGVPAKFVMGLFNSELYQFIFRKRFNSVKVLRSHIEELPVPVPGEKETARFIGAIEEIERGGSSDPLNSMVYKIFGLSDVDISLIRKALACN